MPTNIKIKLDIKVAVPKIEVTKLKLNKPTSSQFKAPTIVRT